MKRTRHKLIIAGTGIQFLSQMTMETINHAKKATKLLYLVNEPAMESWILKNNRSAESLTNLYFQHEVRSSAYLAVVEKILAELETQELLCVLFYGHPTLYCEPGLKAAILAEERGYSVRVLPAISSIDCMLADLKINLVTEGFSSYEASQLLGKKIKPEVSNHLMVWQPAMMGDFNIVKDKQADFGAYTALEEYLQLFYPGNHPVTLYQAALYPQMPASIKTLALNSLGQSKIPRLASLYLPPLDEF